MIEDTLKIVKNIIPKEIETVKEYSTWFEFIKIIIWPIVAIIIVLILRKTIINLLNRINKIGFAGLAAEAVQQKDSIERIQPEKGIKNEIKNEVLEKGLGIFSNHTLERVSNKVQEESKVNTFKSTEDKIDILHKYSQALYLILTFERLYNSIYGSQLDILERTNTNTENRETLKRFYDSAVNKYPEFYSNYTYDEYLDFLISQDLIIFNEEGNCSITWLGRDFLKFLIESGKSLNKFY
jgi:hypothetical protein